MFCCIGSSKPDSGEPISTPTKAPHPTAAFAAPDPPHHAAPATKTEPEPEPQAKNPPQAPPPAAQPRPPVLVESGTSLETINLIATPPTQPAKKPVENLKSSHDDVVEISLEGDGDKETTLAEAKTREVDLGVVWDIAGEGRLREVTIEDDNGATVRILLAALARDPQQSDSHEDKSSHTIATHSSFVAVGTRCPHYGAPLAKGLLCGDRLLCPWHAASFRLPAADVEDAPAFSPLKTIPIRFDRSDSRLWLQLPVPFLAATWNSPAPLVRRSPVATDTTTQFGSRQNPRMGVSAARFPPVDSTVCIVGGGPAALSTAQALRSNGFAGSIIIVSKESYLPYDRPKVSKAISVDIKTILLAPESFYTEQRIELVLGDPVVDLDVQAKKAVTQSGRIISFDYCVIATGCSPRQLELPGSDLKNIFTLRDFPDAAAVNEMSLKGSKVVIIGGSFIGLEVASYMKQVRKIPQVTVISNVALPFEKIFGSEIAHFLFDLQVSKGVDFRLCKRPVKFTGKDGLVTHVELDDGEILEADFVVVGIGSKPATSFVKGLELDSDGGIVCDLHMKTALDHVYVVGDIAKFTYKGEKVRVEHWDVAIAQGTVAGANIAGNTSEIYKSIPFFWTQQFGQSVRFVGHLSSKCDGTFCISNREEKKYATFFCAGEKVLAVASVNNDPLPIAFSELLRLYKVPKKSQLQNMTVEQIVDLAKAIGA